MNSKRYTMEENNFLEEDENIFSDDEVLNYIIYEEVEKELEKKRNSSLGCLATFVAIFTFGGFAVLFIWDYGWK